VGSKKIPAESVRLAECVGDVRALLRQILSDSVPNIHVTRKTSKSRSLKSEYFNLVCLLRSIWNMSDTNLFAIFCALYVQFISVF
jgi:hypothetical protein